MIELRTFDGDLAELQRFIVGVWRQSYGGRMPFPLWPVRYFEWQFGSPDGLIRAHWVAAYEGTKLVGTVLGLPLRFHIAGREYGGTQGSWLSVDPDYRRQKIGSQLRMEMIRRHQEHGLVGQLGYIFQGSIFSLGRPFWKSKGSQGSDVIRRVGMWVRILNSARAAAWSLSPLEATGINLASPVFRVPRPPTGGTVRAARPGDLPVCLELTNEASRASDFGIIWDEVALGRHLEGFGRARVFERDGIVRGLCTYHILPVQGRTEESLGVIDLVVTQHLAGHEARALLADVLCDLHKAGAILALRVSSGDVPWSLMWRMGFFPRPADSGVVCSWSDPGNPPVKSVRSLHVLWR
jgi:GNAT superfamily N-acetyltransferase